MSPHETPAFPGRTTSLVGAVVGSTVATATTTRIFGDGHRLWPALVTCLVTSTVLAVLPVVAASWSRLVHVAVAVAGVVAGGCLAVVAAGGDLPADLGRALTQGVGDIIGARWPAPPSPAGAALVAMASVAAGAVAVELVELRRTTAAVVPPLALVGLVALLSAEAGPPEAWAIGLLAVASLAVVQGGRTSRHSRSGVAITAVVMVLAALVPLGMRPVLSADRYDPRDRLRTPPDLADEVSPLSRVDEWHSLDPDTVMFTTTSPTPATWRLVGLDRYDGTSWQPADDYRPAGRPGEEGTTARGEPVSVGVVIGAIDSPWVPTLPITVAASSTRPAGDGLSTDGTASGLLPDERPVAGSTYDLEVVPTTVLPAQLAGARFATGDGAELDGFAMPPGVQDLASRIVAGAGSDYERAAALASYLRGQYVLDPATPPGHSLAVLDLFLETTRRGRDEQFVAAYGLLAAAAGLPVRIAVGFDTVATPGEDGSLALAPRALAWPEVEFEGVGWARFDPVPDTTAEQQTASGTGGLAPTSDVIVAPPPTTAAPAPRTTEPPDAAVTAPTDQGSSLVGGPAAVTAVAVAGVMAVVTLYLAVVIGWKARRRRRRRHAPSASARAVGAFRSGVDTLVDLGATVRPSATDSQVVHTARRVVGDSAELLAPAAGIATAAVFDEEPPTDADADAAWRVVAEFEEATIGTMGRTKALRAKVSTRSIRRGLPE